MHDRLLVLVALLVTPLVAGCAQIQFFQVSPSTACPGEPVEIRWQASGNVGNVTLNAVPPLDGMGEVPDEGSQSFLPTQSTRFTLKAPGLLKSDQREWDVQVVPSQSSRLLGGIAQCGGDPQSVLTSFSIRQKDTSSRVRAILITNHYHRPLLVNREGMETEIPPNGTTDHFKNVSVTGTWTIRTPVGNNESCENVLDAVAHRLTIKTQMACGL